MERRHVQFALFAFAILLGTQILQARFFPRPQPGAGEPPAVGADVPATEPVASAPTPPDAAAAADGTSPQSTLGLTTSSGVASS